MRSFHPSPCNVGGNGPLDPKGQAIAALNHRLPNEPRGDAMLLAIADGILICRKR